MFGKINFICYHHLVNINKKYFGGNFMSNFSNLLGWAAMFPETSDYGWMGKVFGTVSIVLYIVLGVVGAVGVIYSVYLGIQLARAEEQGKRDDAKKHLITVAISVGVTLLLIVFFNELLPLIVKAFFGDTIDNPKGDSGLLTIVRSARMMMHI